MWRARSESSSGRPGAATASGVSASASSSGSRSHSEMKPLLCGSYSPHRSAKAVTSSRDTAGASGSARISW